MELSHWLEVLCRFCGDTKLFFTPKQCQNREVKKGKVDKTLKQQIYMQLHPAVKMNVVINDLNILHRNMYDSVLFHWKYNYQFYKIKRDKRTINIPVDIFQILQPKVCRYRFIFKWFTFKVFTRSKTKHKLGI